MKIKKPSIQTVAAVAGIAGTGVAIWAWRKSVAAQQAAEDQQATANAASPAGGLNYYLPAGGGGGVGYSSLIPADNAASAADTSSQDFASILSGLTDALSNNAGDTTLSLQAIDAQSKLASQSLGASLISQFLPAGTSGAAQFSIDTGSGGNPLTGSVRVLDVGQANDTLSNTGVAALLDQYLGGSKKGYAYNVPTPTANASTPTPAPAASAPAVQQQTSQPQVAASTQTAQISAGGAWVAQGLAVGRNLAANLRPGSAQAAISPATPASQTFSAQAALGQLPTANRLKAVSIY